MSNLYQRRLSLAGLDTAGLSDEALRKLVREILENKIHGISFSPYVEGQAPGMQLTDGQIRDRMSIIAPHVRWIRTFSCTEGNELIPGVAREFGLKSVVGVWLDDNLEQNEIEIANGIEIARSGQADILAVGNEVLLRGELSETDLIAYIQRAKDAAPGIPVGYVDAYFLFNDYPNVTDACDVVLANCYPFWEGCPAETALLYMKEMYRRAVHAANGKRVIISETGWPDTGTAVGGAVPSVRNAIKYFVDSCQWAEQDDIELFYFSSFDEAWKIEKEGDVGAYWGLWDKDGKPKFF